MIIHILGGGPLDLLPELRKYDDKNIIWVGVDRGVYTLLKQGIKPSMAIGDFDSVSRGELITIEKSIDSLKRFQPEKDETDMELALNWALAQNPATIRIFGATGGRMDHTFGNIQLLIHSTEKQSIHVEIIDQKNIIYFKTPGEYQIQKLKDKKYISFIPITQEVKGITLNGFKYPLINRHISIGSTLCISNELIHDYGTFSFSEGILMIIRSTD